MAVPEPLGTSVPSASVNVASCRRWTDAAKVCGNRRRDEFAAARTRVPDLVMVDWLVGKSCLDNIGVREAIGSLGVQVNQ